MSASSGARPCPVCGSTDESGVRCESNFDPSRLHAQSFASRKPPEFMHHRMVSCPVCTLIYASPMPDLGWIEDSYVEAEFEATVESGYAADTYAEALPRVLSGVPHRSGALDIGAGDGKFMRKLIGAGFKSVAGVEPSKAPREKADDEIRGLIKDGFFGPGMFENDSMSLVTCFQTIEHMPEPLDACRQMLSVLRPGGAVYLAAHDSMALSAKVLGTRSPIYDIEHLQLFSMQSMRRMLEEAGFERIDVWKISNAYPAGYWLRLMPLPSLVKRAIGALMRALALEKRIVRLSAGNIAACGYKKEN